MTELALILGTNFTVEDYNSFPEIKRAR